MPSLWSDFEISPLPTLKGDTKTDVLVIGGGMAGLLCAHELKKAGIHCIVAEASRIGSGITKNITAKVTAQHGLVYRKLTERFGTEIAGLYLEANEKAVVQLRNLCSTLDCDWKDQDSYIYSITDQGSLEAEYDALHSLGFPAEYVQQLPLPFPTAGAVKFPNQGQFHPLKFIAALSQGLRIYENTPVRELKTFCAVTDHGRIFADSFLVATHFPFLNRHGSYFMKLYQQRSYVLALKNTPEFEGMYLDAAENGLSFRHHGDFLLLGGGGHRTGKPGSGWKELEQKAANYYPEAALTHRWAAQDCLSLDGIPYIGRYSKNTPNLYVAAGFNKWGMTGSMVSAKLLTDLVQRKDNPYTTVFSPSRSMLHRQLGINLMESSRNILTLKTPRCPHMGCALQWNPQEHSWDCPCHGSRFEENGRLIDNPATGDMKDMKDMKERN